MDASGVAGRTEQPRWKCGIEEEAHVSTRCGTPSHDILLEQGMDLRLIQVPARAQAIATPQPRYAQSPRAGDHNGGSQLKPAERLFQLRWVEES